MAQFTQLKNALSGSAFTLIDKIKGELTVQDKVASGKLRDTMRFEIVDSGSLITILFKAQAYWINVDKGRRPGAKMPPEANINKWIKQKGLSLRNKSSFGLRVNISVFGIKPTNIYTEATEQYIKDLVTIISTSGLPDVQKQAGDILRQFSNTK